MKIREALPFKEDEFKKECIHKDIVEEREIIDRLTR